MEPQTECLLGGQLQCAEKRELTKRGVRFCYIKLKRNNGYPIKFTVPAAHISSIEIGNYYKIAILPDREPDVQVPLLPTLNPGDHVLEWYKWAGLRPVSARRR